MIEKFGTAKWQGGLKTGEGQISTQTGVLAGQPYGFATRFEGREGTNPEELVGAAHAACFAMALSMELENGGHTPENIDARSTVSLEQQGDGFAITRAHLDVSANVPGATAEEFAAAAEATKTGCPVSRLLDCEITMEARLLPPRAGGAVRG